MLVWVNITFRPITTGVHQGTPAYHIIPTGERAKDEDIAAALYKLRRDKKGWGNVIFLFGPEEGAFNTDNDNDFLTLLASLKNYGYYIIVAIRGKRHHPWLTAPVRVGGQMVPALDWLSVEIDDQPWPVFYCNEIHYTVRDPEKVPILPLDRKNQILLYAHGDEEKVRAFVKKQKERWLTPDQEYEEEI